MKACVGSVVSTSLNDLEVIEQGRDDKLNDHMDIEFRSARLSNRVEVSI